MSLFFPFIEKFHGVYLPSDDEKESEAPWNIPKLAEKLRAGQMSSSDFITAVTTCGKKTVFPFGMKISLIVDGQTVSTSPTEKHLFYALNINEALPVSLSIISKKKNIDQTIVFRD